MGLPAEPLQGHNSGSALTGLAPKRGQAAKGNSEIALVVRREMMAHIRSWSAAHAVLLIGFAVTTLWMLMLGWSVLRLLLQLASDIVS